jgi:hypothetical protein
MAKVTVTHLKTGKVEQVELRDGLRMPPGKAIRWIPKGKSGSLELVDL